MDYILMSKSLQVFMNKNETKTNEEQGVNEVEVFRQ